MTYTYLKSVRESHWLFLGPILRNVSNSLQNYPTVNFCSCVGMEEVETAAADTTSEHSFPGHTHHAHGHTHDHAHSCEPLHMMTPNYSMAANQSYPNLDHQPDWKAGYDSHMTPGAEDDIVTGESVPPASKRRRTESYSAQNLQMSPKTSVHVRRHHGDRPVGIAQPIQLQDTQQTESHSDTEHAEPIKQQQKSVDNSSSSSSTVATQVHVQTASAAERSRHSTSSIGTFGDHSHDTTSLHDLVAPQDKWSSFNYLQDEYDSDQSQDMRRFDKFTNESEKSGIDDIHVASEKLSAREARLEPSQGSTTSEASSESTGRFLAMYANPDERLMEGEAYFDSNVTQFDTKFQDSLPDLGGGGGSRPGLSTEPLSCFGSQQEARPSRHERGLARESGRNSSSKLLTHQSLGGKV